MAGIYLFDGRLCFFVLLVLWANDFWHVIYVIEPFLAGSESFFFFAAINDGLVIGGYAADGEFSEGIFDAAFVEFASCAFQSFVSEVEACRIDLRWF